MKKQFLLTPVLFLLISLLASCSLQKRHYRPGFYHDRAKKTDLVAAPVEECTHAALPEEELPAVKEDVVPAEDSAAAIAAPQVKEKKPFVEKTYRMFSEAEKQMTAVPAYNKIKTRFPARPVADEKEKMDFLGISFASGILALAGILGLLLALSGLPARVSLSVLLLMLASPILTGLAVIFGLFALFDSFANGDRTDRGYAALVFLLALVDLLLLMLIVMRFY